jgi:hypothetical protein
LRLENGSLTRFSGHCVKKVASVTLPSQGLWTQKKSGGDFLGGARIFFVKAFAGHLP